MDHVLHFELRKSYLVIEKGEGIYVFDSEGKKYMDACGGAVVVSIGHGVREIIDAMKTQAERIAFTHRMLFTTEPAQNLAEKISSMTTGSLNKVFFVSGGSEAIETAIKLARKYHLETRRSEKFKVISRWQSYHGNSLGALSVSGHTSRRRDYIPLLINSPHISLPYCYRCPFNKEYPRCNIDCALELERVISQEGEETISAFIAEPIGGAASGALVPPREYFSLIREMCDRHKVLFIADEVMTGFGRTGKNFAIDHWEIIPDMIAVGKGMSSGYTPLGAVIIKEEIVDTIKDGSGIFSHGFTYGGNPLSCAVGIAVLKYLEEKNLISKAQQMGDYLFRKLMDLKRNHTVGDIRGKGLLMGIEFVKNKKTKEPFPPEMGFCYKIVNKAMEKGLCLYPGSGTVNGTTGDHILLGPPFIITQEEIDELVSLLDETISEVEEEVLG